MTAMALMVSNMTLKALTMLKMALTLEGRFGMLRWRGWLGWFGWMG